MNASSSRFTATHTAVFSIAGEADARLVPVAVIGGFAWAEGIEPPVLRDRGQGWNPTAALRAAPVAGVTLRAMSR